MTDAQLKQLAGEIATDPKKLGYADARKDLGALLALLNGKSGPGPVPYVEFQTAMMQMECWGRIRVFAKLATKPPNLDDASFQQILGGCLVAIDLMTVYQGSTVDMSLPAFQQAMGGLSAAGLMTKEEAASTVALADNRSSRAESMGIGPISLDDLMRAN